MADGFDYGSWSHNEATRKLDPDTSPASLTAKYSGGMATPAIGPVRTREELFDAELGLQKDIAAGDATVAGFAVGFETGGLARLTSYLTTGAWEKAVAEDDRHSAIRDGNRDGFLRGMKMSGYGETGQLVSSKCESFANGRYYQNQIRLATGETVTVGQALQMARDRLASGEAGFETELGVDHDTAAMYSTGSVAQRKALGILLDKFSGKAPAGAADRTGTAPAGAADRTGTAADNARMLANETTKRWDSLASVYGEDGVANLVSFVEQSTKATDDGRDMLVALDAYGKAFGGDARAVARGYDQMLQYVMRPDDPRLQSSYKPTAQDRLTFNSMILPAVHVAAKRVGSRFSFEDPATRDACLDVADTIAWCKANGVDLYRHARRAGVDVNDAFGNYVADASDGIQSPASSFVRNLGIMRSYLSRQLMGAPSSAEAVFRRTGQVSDYKSSVARTVGAESSNPTASAMSAYMMSDVLNAVAPYMVSGDSNQEALRKVYADPNRRREVTEAMAGHLGSFMFGDGAQEAASYLAGVLFNQAFGTGTVRLPTASGKAVSSNVPGTLQDIIETCWATPGLAFSEQARRCFARIHVRDTGRADRFASERRAAHNAILAAHGNDARTAARFMAIVDTSAQAAEEAGYNPMSVYGPASTWVNVMLPIKLEGDRVTYAPRRGQWSRVMQGSGLSAEQIAAAENDPVLRENLVTELNARAKANLDAQKREDKLEDAKAKMSARTDENLRWQQLKNKLQEENNGSL